MATTAPQAVRAGSNTTTASAGAWTLNRIFVVLAAVSNLLALYIFLGPAMLGVGILEAGPALPGVVVSILLAVRPWAWAYLAGGILNSVLPLMVLGIFVGPAALANPLTGLDYASLLLLLAAVVLGLPAGIRGFMEARKGMAQHGPMDVFRSRHGAAVASVILFLAGLGVAGVLASSTAAESAAAGGGYDFVPAATATSVAKDFKFTVHPTVTAGVITEIAADNQDTAFHTFTYKVGGKTYNHDLLGGTTTKFLVKLDAAGAITYWCKPHAPTEGQDPNEMRGTLTVTAP